MTSKVRARGEQVRSFILENVEAHDGDLAALVATKFDITRQAVNKHIKRMKDQGTITQSGPSRAPKYKLCETSGLLFEYNLTGPKLEEDVVWSQDIRPALEPLPENVLKIWNHGFTEMFNNVIDHSGGKKALVEIRKTANTTEIMVFDDGIGIFRKIQMELDLWDERQAIFELSKGKLTTDSRNHSGEGIFFTSRMFDQFAVVAGGLHFSHDRTKPFDWLTERSAAKPGTAVFMELNNHTARTTTQTFKDYMGDDFSFNKTVVPVKLAKYGADELVSRSQAKRLLSRVNLFQIVIFDFSDVASIGQAFADQIFRVFANEHPEIELIPVNDAEPVKEMIERARAHKSA